MASKYPAPRHRGREVGLFVAAASAPRSMQSGLMPRDTKDQGIVTGTTMATAYMLGAAFQDIIDGATDAIVNDRVKRGVITKETAEKKRITYSAIASGVALFGGLAGQRLLKQQKDEPLLRPVARTVSFWTAVAGVAGLAVAGLEAGARSITKDNKRPPTIWPFIIPFGALFAMSLDAIRRPKIQSASVISTVKPWRALGIGVGVSFILASLAAGEDAIAKQTDKLVAKYLPALKSLRIPVGHAVGLGIITAGVQGAVQYVMHKAEQGGDVIEDGFRTAPTSSLVSGSMASLVPWETLSKEGRRFVSTARPRADINKIMHTKKAKNPIRIFVGLDSEFSEEKRVQLALAELERTHAYERSVIVVVSPTGTGYINYVMAESVEYCSKGDAAIVALQYSKRPSPLSLDRVSYGHAQYRMFLNGMKKYLKQHPEYHPRIVLFGESLGAWTSQDAFMHQGTEGFEVLNVSAALWIGTPTQSTWKNEVLAPQRRLDTDYSTIGAFHSTNELFALPDADRESLQYVMLTNANDPIAKFGLRLLFQAPDWLQNDNPLRALTNVPRWRTPGTFLQTLVDMKNALKPKPGEFVSDGHDYRATLLPFVNEIYRFKVPQDQLPEIEKALIRNEIARAKRISGTA